MKPNRSIIAVLCLLLGLISLRLRVGEAQGPAVTITIDAAANRHTINPNIYGVAFASTAQLADLNCPLNRSGGNATSQYNWQCNCGNHGSDWYFESLDEGSSTAGKVDDDFIADSKAAGAKSMLTIPTIGWVAKLGPNRGKLASFSIAKYGPQKANDWQWFPDAGNGTRASDGQNVTGNDPNDANIPADSQFELRWMQHLVSTWGTAANGGLRYYLMDNEPSLWSWSHRDVHPVGPTMDEIKDKMIDYGSKVRLADSSALIAGPEEWGWGGYFYSGYDQQWGDLHGWSNLPDRANHGGKDYLPWLLDQLHQHDVVTGLRSLDVFTVHWYPQGGEALNNDVSPSLSNLRNRSTRSLWDPNYTDESWVNSQVQLIPRLRNWVNSYYPGLQIGITEYNWGAEPYINGATTQADVFGIFGREGLDLATRWTTPDASSPTFKAMKMYRNYDGKRSTFGDMSISDSVPDPDTLSSFAALRSSDGALTVMIINKSLSNSTLANVNFANFSGGGSAQVWQLTSANAINRLSDINFGGHSLNLTVPAQSITLLVIAAAVPPPLRLDTVSPVAGRTSGSQQIHLMGAFAGLSMVTMGGVSASWAYTNGGGATSDITVTTPVHLVGAVQIALSPSSGTGYSKPYAFAYLPTMFTDDTLVAGTTAAKVQHIIELRQAVDALRAVAGLTPAPWTDATLTPGGSVIRAVHIQELRTYLDDAATRLGYATSPYTDPSLTTGYSIKRIYIEELRQRIRFIAG